MLEPFLVDLSQVDDVSFTAVRPAVPLVTWDPGVFVVEGLNGTFVLSNSVCANVDRVGVGVGWSDFERLEVGQVLNLLFCS